MGYSFLRSLFRPTPLWVHLYVTRHCNFSCKYCGALDNTRPDPTLKELKQRILKVKSLGGRIIGFMGGEPTLRRDIVDIVRFCSQNGMYTQLPTNGTFLIAPALKKEGKTLLRNLVEAGLGTINISVDSLVGGFMDSDKELPRANGVLEALMEEKKRGLTVVLNCVVTKKNIDQVAKMVEFCHRKRMMMLTIFAQDPFPLEPGKNPSGIKDTFLTKEDKKKVEKLLNFLTERKKKGYWLGEPLAYYQAVRDWLDGRVDWNCDGGKYSLAIDTDGKVAICGYLPYTKYDLMELEKSFFKNLEPTRDRYLPRCTKICLPLCMFGSAYYRTHPIHFAYERFRYLKAF